MDKTLDPKIFEDAINLLRTEGWTNDPNSGLKPGYPLCIWQAVRRSWTENTQGQSFELYENALIDQVGADGIEELWNMNDGLPKDDGLVWALDVLRALHGNAEAELTMWERAKRWLRNLTQ